MSSNPLNDLSKVYLDQVANVKKAENEADIQRWEEIGGPTPTNYKPTGSSAKLKTESVSLSDWRNDIFEAGDPDATQTPGFKNSKDAKKKITEKSGINNTVVINPKLNEAIKEIGGELIEVAEVESDPLEDAIEYFYEEGINEEGIDQLIEEIGLEEFVDFVDGGAVELNEERAARRASVRAKKFDVVKKEVDKADAARKKAKKGEYAPSYAKKETDVTVYDDKPATKKKAVAKKPAAPKKPVAPKKPAAPAKPKKPVTKKVVKAVAKVKKTQPVKKATKQGLGDKIRSAYKAGVKRHRKATQGARVFGKGFAAGAKKAVKFAKDVKKVVSEGEELTELSKRTLGNYVKDASSDAAMTSMDHGNKPLAKDAPKREKKILKRLSGIRKATDKLSKEEVVYEKDVKKVVSEGVKGEDNEMRKVAAQERKKGIGKLKSKKAGESYAKWAVATHPASIDEDDQTRKQQLQRKQLMIDRQKLQLRRKALGQKKKEGETETDAQANIIANEGVMTMLRKIKKKPEKKAEKAMDAGARAKRMLARKIHAKYVSGSEENVPDDIRESDKAFDFVKNKLKAKYGDGVLTTGEKMKPPTAAQKKANAVHRAKIAKQQAAEFKKDPSQGRYPPGYSNVGSD